MEGVTCPKCNGSGSVKAGCCGRRTCSTCHGVGVVGVKSEAGKKALRKVGKFFARTSGKKDNV